MEKYERLYHEQIEINRTLKADNVVIRKSMRDQMAMAALTGLTNGRQELVVQLASEAYKVADAMMTERDKKEWTP